MPQPLDDYLRHLEQASANTQVGEKYLWPRTPRGGDLQDKILQRMGVTDRDVNDPRSRPAMIIAQVRRLQAKGLLGPAPVILDIACGDALVLLALKQAIPGAACCGLDCDKGGYATHEAVQREGVGLYRGFIQDLFASAPPMPFDIALMLNTYRGWESADLHAGEGDLPRQADQWLLQNSRYAIVTATPDQIARLKRGKVNVQTLGKGEDNSLMVCFARGPLPVTVWERLAGRWRKP